MSRLLLCFFLLKESKALGRIIIFLQGFPYTTVRALVPRATRYRV